MAESVTVKGVAPLASGGADRPSSIRAPRHTAAANAPLPPWVVNRASKVPARAAQNGRSSAATTHRLLWLERRTRERPGPTTSTSRSSTPSSAAPKIRKQSPRSASHWWRAGLPTSSTTPDVRDSSARPFDGPQSMPSRTTSTAGTAAGAKPRWHEANRGLRDTPPGCGSTDSPRARSGGGAPTGFSTTPDGVPAPGACPPCARGTWEAPSVGPRGAPEAAAGAGPGEFDPHATSHRASALATAFD